MRVHNRVSKCYRSEAINDRRHTNMVYPNVFLNDRNSKIDARVRHVIWKESDGVARAKFRENHSRHKSDYFSAQVPTRSSHSGGFYL